MVAPDYIDWIREQPCAACHGHAVPHHLIGKGDGTMSGKQSDIFTMPLCDHHHTGEQGIHTLTVPVWESIYGNQWMLVAKTLYRAICCGKLVVV